MDRVDSATLKGTDFFRLLEYAVRKAIAHEDMTANDIKDDLGISAFANFCGVVIDQHGHRAAAPGTTIPVPAFRITPQSFLVYLQYRELEDAREASVQAEQHAQQAENHARQSHRTAITAIVISVVLALVNLGVGLWTCKEQPAPTPSIPAMPGDQATTTK